MTESVQKESNRGTKLYQHCLAIYEAMLANASMRNVGDERTDTEESGVDILVYEGTITRLFAETFVPTSYYSPVRRNLVDHGCITMLQAGNGAVPSLVALHHSPADVPWYGRQEKPREGLTEDEQYAKLRLRIEGLEKRTGGINILVALRDIELRLREVEESLGVKTYREDGSGSAQA